MSWVIYLKFLSARKFVLIELLTLNYIFTYFLNATWLFYQLIIHACFVAIFLEIFLKFKIFNVKRLDESCSDCQMVKWDVLTHASVEGWHGSPRPDELSDASGRLPYMFKIISILVDFACFFSCFLKSSCPILSLCALSLHFRYFAVFCILFSSF